MTEAIRRVGIGIRMEFNEHCGVSVHSGGESTDVSLSWMSEVDRHSGGSVAGTGGGTWRGGKDRKGKGGRRKDGMSSRSDRITLSTFS